MLIPSRKENVNKCICICAPCMYSQGSLTEKKQGSANAVKSKFETKPKSLFFFFSDSWNPRTDKFQLGNI